MDCARAELGVLLEQLQVQAAGPTATWQQILARLDTASDPAVMTAQLRAGTATAVAQEAHAARHLLQDGDRLTGMARLPWPGLTWLADRVRTVEVDGTDHRGVLAVLTLR